jgi:2-aminoadipate transaminase
VDDEHDILSSPPRDPLSVLARTLKPSVIRRVANIQRPDTISFAAGHPSPDAFPLERFRDLAVEIMRTDGAATFQYIPPRGLDALVAAVQRYLAGKGVRAPLPEILITEGSQQGLDLIARVLIDPGDTVLVELPSYIGALSIFRGVGAELLGVRLDDGGIDLDDLRAKHRAARAAGRPVKLLYVNPTFQNPSGVSHTLERRRALLELAEELDLRIVEDDAYGELYFEDAPVPTIKSLDRNHRVIYVASFSKILAPGLRSAFVVAPEHIMTKLAIAKHDTTVCGSGLDQRIVNACLERGVIEEQGQRLRPCYRRKRDALLAGLEATMPPGVTWTRPEGGMFVWVTLPAQLYACSLLETAVERGVSYLPGATFYTHDVQPNTMRLTFASATVERITEGMRRLGAVISDALRATPPP